MGKFTVEQHNRLVAIERNLRHWQDTRYDPEHDTGPFTADKYDVQVVATEVRELVEVLVSAFSYDETAEREHEERTWTNRGQP